MFLRSIISTFCLLVFTLGVSRSTNIVESKHTLNRTYFKSNNQRLSYALGSSLGNYIKRSLNEQKKLGISLDKENVLIGITDSLLKKSILSENEVSAILQKLDSQLKSAEELILFKKIKENDIKGKEYIKKLLVKKNVRHSKSGLVFFIDKLGKGNKIKNSDIVTVNYRGYFINGSEFDNSYVRNKPLSFPIDSVIEGWKEGLKYIRKGGKIKLIIPPKLAYGINGVSGIPGNSTLIFDIELLDVQSQ